MPFVKSPCTPPERWVKHFIKIDNSLELWVDSDLERRVEPTWDPIGVKGMLPTLLKRSESTHIDRKLSIFILPHYLLRNKW